jgi:hypothetical protein
LVFTKEELAAKKLADKKVEADSIKAKNDALIKGREDLIKKYGSQEIAKRIIAY